MCGPKLSKVICLSSIGANRVSNMPFALRNIGGDLDTKRAVEQAIKHGSQVMWCLFFFLTSFFFFEYIFNRFIN